MNMTKFLGLLVFAALSFSFSLHAQESPVYSSAQRILTIVDELEAIQIEKDSYLNSLENINQERLNELNEREKDLQRQILISTNLENLVDDQAIYTHKLERKLKFYRTTTIVVSVTLIAAVVIAPVVAKHRK